MSKSLMSDSFQKLKRKALFAALIKSVLVGVFVGLFVVGALLLPFKLCNVQFYWPYYLLIGAGAALLAGGILFLLIRPTDVRLAKELDAAYALHEKVQTMVEFGGQSGELVTLQRENTSNILQTVPRRKLSFARVWQYVAISVVACALFATGVALPGRAQQTEPVDGPVDEEFEITKWQIAALAQLIEEVRGSALSEELSASVVSVLEDLLSRLQTTEWSSAMRTAVVSSVVLVDAVIASANSYRTVAAELEQSESLQNFGASITAAVISYRNDGGKITKIAQVEEKAAGLAESAATVLRTSTDAFYAGIAEFNVVALPNALNDFLLEITPRLAATGYDLTDGLYAALSAFAEGVRAVANSSGYSLATLRAKVADSCEAYVISAAEATAVQSYNCMMDEFIRNRLAEIFSLASSELPANPVLPDLSADPETPSGGDDDGPNTGGYGPGDTEYGSDDLIYYPDDREYVEYGKVVNEYYNKVNELIQNGTVSEELAQYIKQYFAVLISGNGE